MDYYLDIGFKIIKSKNNELIYLIDFISTKNILVLTENIPRELSRKETNYKRWKSIEVAK